MAGRETIVTLDRALDPTGQFAPPIYDLEPQPLQVYEGLCNRELSIYRHKDEINQALNSHQVVIIKSPTGTGKSTQVPQIALEAGFRIIRESQPRRRAGMNVADRIGSELSLLLGEEPAAELVSCQTGGGLIGSYEARIQVMTEGVLRVRDTFEPTSGDNEVWILDEAHEGSAEMWMLGGIVKEKLANNPNFTVVVMTATPNMHETVDYYTSELGIEPKVIEIEGSTNFDIEKREEPESTTAREAVKAALDIFENPDAHDGANTIQVFEAGKREIKETIAEIYRQLPAEVLAKCRILQNHAKMTPGAQAPVYEDFDGIKIVVQTNIGKTSMTIPRTRYVIISGKERMMEFDDTDVGALMKVDSSQDDIIQYIGRAGRTSSGIAILTRHKGDEFVSMSERPPHLQPEILRSKIDYVVMALAMRGTKIRDFDGNPVIPDAIIKRSIHRLQTLGALDEREELTKLGQRMGKYPASPEHQRCLVQAEQYSEQIRLSMAAMVAAAEVGGLRLYESGSPIRLTDETSSDLFAQLETFRAVKWKRLNTLTEEDLDKNNIVRAEELYRKIARRAGVQDIPNLKILSDRERKILRECIVTGFANSAFLPIGEDMFRAVGGLVSERTIGNRSVVSPGTHNAVVGQPRDIELEKDGKSYRKPIIEHVTEVPVSELGKYIIDQTRWQATGYRLRAGKFVEVHENVLEGRVLQTREVPASPSPQLRAAVIDQVRTRPGPHLVELYKMKNELERLDRRARHSIVKLTDDAINAMIAEAAPDDVVSPGHIDENLRQMIVERSITLDAYVTQEQRAKIMADAPDQITIGDYELHLRYSRNKAIARHWSIDMIEGLEHEPTLPDGRPIYFMHDDKRLTFLQLRNSLRFASEL
jgi:HrpA-like RNA helicase